MEENREARGKGRRKKNNLYRDVLRCAIQNSEKLKSVEEQFKNYDISIRQDLPEQLKTHLVTKESN